MAHYNIISGIAQHESNAGSISYPNNQGAFKLCRFIVGPASQKRCFHVDERRFFSKKSYMTTTGCALREYGSPNVFRNIRLQQGEL